MYVYRGAELDAHLPAPEYEKTRPSCGTRSGYILHCRYKEDACVPCMDAAAAYQRDYYNRTKARKVNA